MTIKQLGGVFGRNPTFNDVTIEGQLTFDGDIDINSDLKVDGDIEATGSVTADSLVIGTSSIDASGNLLLNTTNSPTTTEAIISSDYSAAGTTNTGLTITGRSSGNWYNNGIHALGTALAFSTATTGTTGADATNERMRIDSVGHAIIPSGVTLGTATGVYNAAKTLDDYEEGTWTPNISDAVTGGNVGGGFYAGRYTKVGNLVYVTGYMINGTTTGMTAANDLYIQGLPFTSINESSLVVSGSVTTSSVTTTGNLTTNLLNNVTAFRISESVSGAAEDYLEVSNLSTGNSDLFFTFSYRAA